MKVKTVLEKKLRLLDLQYEILCIKKDVENDEMKQYQVEGELRLVEEHKVYLQKLIYSLTWENWIGETRVDR